MLLGPMAARPAFLDALAQGPLVFDGAMGTQLYERGVFLTNNLDEANLSKPDLVRAVHRDYLAAGAQVLETNTFGANAARLARHGLAGKVREVNAAAAAVAREVAGDLAWVAGSVGPTGLLPATAWPASEPERLARDAFAEQMTALAAAGVDLLAIETIRHPVEMRLALQTARAVTKLPVVAFFCFDEEGRLADGTDPGRAAELLVEWGADVVGANCGVGPHELFPVAERMLGKGRPVAISPNAGFPRLLDGRRIYLATPEYFGVHARRLYQLGVRAVGGCCGTNSDHVRRVAAAARMRGGGKTLAASGAAARGAGGGAGGAAGAAVEGGAAAGAPVREPLPVAERSGLGAKLGRRFVASVEIDAPRGLDPGKAIEGARLVYEGGADVINIADGPRASARMSNLALAVEVQRALGMEVILHVCTRDRNLLALQADLLGAHVLGIRNLVIITGDPPKMGDYPNAAAVYDVDSIGLIRMVAALNGGVDPAGKDLGARTSFAVACGVEPAALDRDRELRRLEEKLQAGANFVMTQPVYDPRLFERFLDDVRPFRVPVLMGVLPLASYRNAEFLHAEVPGMQIPDHIRERMRRAGQGPPAAEEGLRIAEEAVRAVRARIQGVYLMPPFGRYKSALRLIAPDVVGDREQLGSPFAV
jgi:homocysteine S-methyltransferase